MIIANMLLPTKVYISIFSNFSEKDHPRKAYLQIYNRMKLPLNLGADYIPLALRA